MPNGNGTTNPPTVPVPLNPPPPNTLVFHYNQLTPATHATLDNHFANALQDIQTLSIIELRKRSIRCTIRQTFADFLDVLRSGIEVISHLSRANNNQNCLLIFPSISFKKKTILTYLCSLYSSQLNQKSASRSVSWTIITGANPIPNAAQISRTYDELYKELRHL